MENEDGKSDPNVFISYSRDDVDFADELVGGLEIAEFRPLIDRQSIAEGEKWKARLNNLIADSDTVVVILTPSSIRSKTCAWEIEQAVRFSKRILPVAARPFGDAQPPELLSNLNYVRFDDGTPFTVALKALIQSLRTDIDWVREHTRLLTRAIEWDAAGRPENRLLFGSDIEDAKQWISRMPDNAPPPTELHRDFISTSEENESERLTAERQKATALQRAVSVMRLALGFAVILGGVAVYFGHDAKQQSRKAISEAKRATVALQEAKVARTKAETESSKASRFARNAQIARAMPIVVGAEQLIAEGDAQSALLLAIEAASTIEKVKVSSESKDSELIRAKAKVLSDLSRVISTAWVAKAEKKIFVGHEGAITDVLVVPNSNHVFTASTDATIGMWHAVSGGKIKVLKGHFSSVNDLSLSNSNKRLASASSDRTVKIWDAQTGKLIDTLQNFEGKVYGVQFVGDDKTLLTNSYGDGVKIWDLTSGKVIKQIKPNNPFGYFTQAALSPDRKFLVTGDKTLKLWKIFWDKETTDDKDGVELKSHLDWIRAIRFSSDGQMFASASDDTNVVIWKKADTGETFEVGERIRGHNSHVYGLDFSVDSERLVTVSKDGSARIWSVRTGDQMAVLTGHDSAVNSVAFAEDANQIVTGSNDWTARVWSITEGSSRVLRGHSEWLSRAQFSRDGTLILTASMDGSLGLWDATSGTFLRRYRPVNANSHKQFLHAEFSPDESLILGSSNSGSVFIFDAHSDKQVGVLKGQKDASYCARYSPDQKLVAQGATNGRLILWDAKTKKQLAELKAHDGRITEVIFSPDGRLLATTSSDKLIKLWSVKNLLKLVAETVSKKQKLPPPKAVAHKVSESTEAQPPSPILEPTDESHGLQRILKGHTKDVLRANFSPDGRSLVSGSQDGKLIIWDVETGKILRGWYGHTSQKTSQTFTIYEAQFSPDNKKVISVGSDNTARLWQVSTGEQIAIFKGHTHELSTVSFHRSGRKFVTGSGDRTARVWNVPPNSRAIRRAAKKNARRCLTDEQRRSYGLPEILPDWCKERWPREPLSLFRSGLESIENGQFVKAKDSFKLAVMQDPDLAEKIVSSRSLENKNALKVELLDQALEKKPELTDALIARGKIHLTQNKYAAAINDFKIAAQHDPKEISNIISVLNSSRKRPPIPPVDRKPTKEKKHVDPTSEQEKLISQFLVELYSKKTNSNPKDYTAFQSRAMEHYRLGNFKQAAQDLKQFGRKDRWSVEAALNRPPIVNDHDFKIRFLNLLLEDKANSSFQASLYFLRAIEFYKIKSLDAAKADFLQALHLDSNYVIDFNQRMYAPPQLDASAKDNILELAHLVNSKAIELRPSDSLPLLTRGDIHLALNQSEEAEKDLTQAARVSPENTCKLLLNSLRLENFAMLRRVVGHAFRFSKKAVCQVARGALRMQSGNQEAAERDLKAAKELDGSLVGDIAMAYGDHAKFAEVREWLFTRALELPLSRGYLVRGRNAQWYIGRARAREQLEKFKEALLDYEKAKQYLSVPVGTGIVLDGYGYGYGLRFRMLRSNWGREDLGGRTAFEVSQFVSQEIENLKTKHDLRQDDSQNVMR